MLDKVKETLTPIIKEIGYELVDIEYKKQYGEYNLTIFIYKKGGIAFDDCEIVHNAINPVLDELNPTGETPYILNVSSPGLDRPIITPRDYERAQDTEVEILLNAPLERMQKYKGKLIGLINDCVVIEYKNRIVNINKDMITVTRPLISFRRTK